MNKRSATILLLLPLLFTVMGFSDPPALTPVRGPDLFKTDLSQFQAMPQVMPPELNFPSPPQGVEKEFLLGGKEARAGIEVRIKGELAAVTDAAGQYTLPPGVPENATLEFAVNGKVFCRSTAKEKPGSGRTAFGSTRSSGQGSLYGLVYDEDGLLPGALVIVTDGESYAFDVSNSLGVYTVMGAPTGQVLVLALAELHESGLKSVKLDPQVPEELDIFLPKMQGLGKLYGQAYIPGYGLLSGVYVNFSQPGGLVREDLTNLYGMYELEAIPAGVGHLYAAKTGFHDFNQGLMILPGYNEQNIPMIPIQTGAVIGQIFAANGDPLAGALVRLTYQNLHGDYDWMFTYSGEEGAFAFGEVPPGSYGVQSFIPGWHPGTAIGTVFEGQMAYEALIMWPTQETGTLEGWAVDFDGNPVPFAFGYVTYIGFDEAVSGWAVADAFGRFEIEGVPYGPYAVRVESAVFLPDWAFSDILPNEEDDFLKILYPFNPLLSGALGGTIFDGNGQPVPYAVVGCWALEDENVSFKTFSDGNGNYIFPFLPPAVYGAIAVHGQSGIGSGFDEVIQGETTLLDIVLE